MYDFNGKAAMPIFTQALRSGEFYKHLNTHPSRSYNELMRIAYHFVEAEEANKRKREEVDIKVGGRSEWSVRTN